MKLILKEQVSPLSLSNVLYVLQFSCNLISVSKLAQNGYKIVFDSKGCLIYKESVTTGLANPNWIACAVYVYTNGLYKLNVCVSEDSYKLLPKDHSLFLEVSQESPRASLAARISVDLWHKRLGHLSLQGMKCLRDGACGVMFQDEDLQSCVTCLEGKITLS